MPESAPGPRTILLTGATGYIGGRLLPLLLERGHRVRCLVRDPARARLPAAADVVRGDVLRPETLAQALDGVDVAFYLVHSMGRGEADFAEADRRAARAFGDAASAAGTARVVYLGGLESAESEHLRSREEVGELLAERVPGTVHARAAMVVGAGSASFRMLRQLVERLPVMVAPRWVDTRTQPIAVDDVCHALAALATHADPPPEVQLGGADVLTYREMLLRYADASGAWRPLIVPVPVLSPRLSSYWVGIVTSVSAGLARPLVQGLSAEMIVRAAPPPGINDVPSGFDEAVRRALAEARA